MMQLAAVVRDESRVSERTYQQNEMQMMPKMREGFDDFLFQVLTLSCLSFPKKCCVDVENVCYFRPKHKYAIVIVFVDVYRTRNQYF